MTLVSFASSTIEVIKEDGIEEYLPTIILPHIDEFRVIEGIPPNVDHKEAIQNVIRRSGFDTEEFIFGVLSAPGVITIGHFVPDHDTQFMQITYTDGGYKVDPVKDCTWWKVSK